MFLYWKMSAWRISHCEVVMNDKLVVMGKIERILCYFKLFTHILVYKGRLKGSKPHQIFLL